MDTVTPESEAYFCTPLVMVICADASSGRRTQAIISTNRVRLIIVFELIIILVVRGYFRSIKHTTRPAAGNRHP
jgi:hypothetical protein